MNNFLLAVDITDPNYIPESAKDKLLYGVQMLGVGILTVFSVLIIIWFSLVLFKWLFYDIPNMKKGGKTEKPKKQKKPKASKKEAGSESAAEYVPAASADTALIAAITAAIMSERKKAGLAGGFRVVSFRRK